MSSGWIKLHRKMVDWEWYTDANTCRLFIHLMLKAQHSDSNYQGVVIPKGSLKTGRIQLSVETGLSQQQVRTSLNKLKSTSEITIKTTNKYSIIAVNNWDEHQQDNQQTTKRVTINQPTSNQQVTTCKNDKKEENEKKTTLSAKAECDLIISELDGKRRELIKSWCDHKQEIRKPYKPKGLRALITKMSKFSDDVLEKSIENSMSNGHLGLFPESLKPPQKAEGQIKVSTSRNPEDFRL